MRAFFVLFCLLNYLCVSARVCLCFVLNLLLLHIHFSAVCSVFTCGDVATAVVGDHCDLQQLWLVIIVTCYSCGW